MSLHHEQDADIPQHETVTAQAKIDADTKEFLSKGGSVVKIGSTRAVPSKLQKEYDAMAEKRRNAK